MQRPDEAEALSVSKSPMLGTETSSQFPQVLYDEDYLRSWIEGYALLVVIIIGTTANLFSLIIIRNKELNLIRDFSQLLQSQVSFY